jgi:hypothetical protein
MSLGLVKKWEAAEGKMSIKDIKDRYIKENLATLLENQERKDFNGQEVLTETSQGVTNYGSLGGYTDGAAASDSWIFRPIALALVRRTFPDLFANKVVGVQAMSTPVGLAYALRVLYNDSSNNEVGWDRVPEYAGYTGSQVGTSGILNGGFTNTSADSGVYDTSATGQTTSAAEEWQIDNPYVSASSTDWPQLKMRIDQLAITAKSRKLAASFSLEAAQDVKAMHGIDVEREMVQFLQYEVTAELDRELIARMKTAATTAANGGATISPIDLTGGANSTGIDGRWSGEKYMNIIASIVYQANTLAITTRRGPGNFVIVSPAIATALQAAGHQFVGYNQNVNATQVMASIGKLNGGMEVYRDQYARAEYALVGYKGPGISDSGIIFSPYIMGLTNRAIHPQDFTPRIGVLSRYAITDTLLGSGRYYRLIPYFNVNKLIPGAYTSTLPTGIAGPGYPLA